ncbi:hypothetical protein GCM10010345_30950 [Streptomyces canarius]|uniref:Uncharacterized protein n=1 Tax=Streptomyces canarius TaxID=285453 RepID=A0ABQ3CKI1_9ACTN|nr:hypothetical protein GCM10010345_30950 [Streptomyces canarius]
MRVRGVTEPGGDAPADRRAAEPGSNAPARAPARATPVSLSATEVPVPAAEVATLIRELPWSDGPTAAVAVPRGGTGRRR